MTRLIDTLAERVAPGPPRHPEKAHRPDQPVARKPPWIRVKAPGSPVYSETMSLVRELKLTTVCEEASCPNIGECWDKRHATFMIMGETCTRACAFCNVRTGLPDPLDEDEPGARRRRRRQAWLGPCRGDLGRPRRSRRRRGAAFRPHHRRHPPRRAQDHDRGADAGFPAQGRGARGRRRGQAGRVQPQSRNRAVEISDRPSGRALLRFAEAPAARQGAGPVAVHQVGRDGRAWAKSATKSCR